MKTYLILVAIKPGDPPPKRTVSCDQCSHWEGGRVASQTVDVGARCRVLGGLHPKDFGCAYFLRDPNRRA